MLTHNYMNILTLSYRRSWNGIKRNTGHRNRLREHERWPLITTCEYASISPFSIFSHFFLFIKRLSFGFYYIFITHISGLSGFLIVRISFAPSYFCQLLLICFSFYLKQLSSNECPYT